MRKIHVGYRAVAGACAAAFVLTACGGGGDGRPSVSAIAASMKGTQTFSGLTDADLTCLATEFRKSDLTDDDLKGLIDDSLPATRIDAVSAAKDQAASACGLIVQ